MLMTYHLLQNLWHIIVNSRYSRHSRIVIEIQNGIRIISCPNLLFKIGFEIIIPLNLLFRTGSRLTNFDPYVPIANLT